MSTDENLEDTYKIHDCERRWSELEDHFKRHGYNFRPRFRKGWTPSWHSTGMEPWNSEDGELLGVSYVIDAYTNDDKLVAIKRTNIDNQEATIAQMLSTEEMRKDPRNHCVPIIEVIKDPNDQTTSYMVMPLLRHSGMPLFEYIIESVDFVDQVLEGLVFLHEKNVAHRDCVMWNILMDADKMFPEGLHPARYGYKPDFSGPAPYVPRSTDGVHVKYYFIDFNISVHIPEDCPSKTVTGIHGRDRDPPELSRDIPYDPFKLDIFIIGNMFKQEFCETFSNAEFLRPLANLMTEKAPGKRPTAVEARAKWLEMRKPIVALGKRRRLFPRDEYPPYLMFLRLLESLDIIFRGPLESLYNFSKRFAHAIVRRLCG